MKAMNFFVGRQLCRPLTKKLLKLSCKDPNTDSVGYSVGCRGVKRARSTRFTPRQTATLQTDSV